MFPSGLKGRSYNSDHVKAFFFLADFLCSLVHFGRDAGPLCLCPLPQQHLDIVPHIIMCVWRFAAQCCLIYSASGWVIASLMRALKTNIIQTCRSLHSAITPWLGMKDLIQYSLPRAQFTCRCVLLEVSRLYNFHLDKVCTQIEKGQWVLHLIN